MATCDFCGQRSGWFGAKRFSEQHRVCEDRWKAVVLSIRACVSSPEGSEVVVKQAWESAAAESLTRDAILRAMANGWTAAVDAAIAAGGDVDEGTAERLSELEETIGVQAIRASLAGGTVDEAAMQRSLTSLLDGGAADQAQGFDQYVGDEKLFADGKDRLTFARQLSEIRSGVAPVAALAAIEVRSEDLHPFNLQPTERLVLLLGDVTHVTIDTRREYVGGSAGVSIPLKGGLRLKLGSFRGRPVEIKEEKVATGMIGVTNRHVYFAGGADRVRIPLDRIIYTELHGSNGVAIERDGPKAEPELFLRQHAGPLLMEAIRRAPSFD